MYAWLNCVLFGRLSLSSWAPRCHLSLGQIVTQWTYNISLPDFSLAQKGEEEAGSPGQYKWTQWVPNNTPGSKLGSHYHPPPLRHNVGSSNLSITLASVNHQVNSRGLMSGVFNCTYVILVTYLAFTLVFKTFKFFIFICSHSVSLSWQFCLFMEYKAGKRYMERQWNHLSDKLVWIEDGTVGVMVCLANSEILGATNDKKLCRTMTGHPLKGYGTQKKNTERDSWNYIDTLWWKRAWRI